MSSAKAARSSERRRKNNQPLRTKARTFVAKAREHIVDGDLEKAEYAVQQACSALDKGSLKGVLHRNNSARRKSRLMRQLSDAKAISSEDVG
jgi:small subunit ribosomal protein S20